MTNINLHFNNARGPVVIGFVGHAGHGKDTASAVCMDIPNSFRLALADDLKLRIMDLYPDFPEFGVYFDPETGAPEQNPAHDEADPRIQLIVRRTRQVDGTDIFRTFDPDWWLKAWAVRAMEQVCRGKRVILVPDIRFLNELQFFQRYNGFFIGVDRGNYRRPGVDYTHPSETAIPQLLELCDVVVPNHGTVEEFEDQVRRLIRGLSR